MNNLNKKALQNQYDRVSWDPNDPKASYWSTVNPLSFLTGGVDKVPGWWMDKFPEKKVIGDLTGKQLGHLTFKAGAVGLLTAGLVGGLRLAIDADELIHGKGTAVDAGAKGKLSTTFDPAIYELDRWGNRKKKKQPVQPAVKEASAESDKKLTSGKYTDLSSYNQLGFAVPAAATMLAAFLAYTASDEITSGARRILTDQKLADRTEDLNNLMIQRARLAKGNLKELPEYENPYTKTAGDDSKEESGFWKTIKDFFAKTLSPTGNNAAAWGALKYAALLATGIGSYMYFSKNNEENMKYKAYRNALGEYVKGKTNRTPLTVAPSNSDELFEAIDKPDEDQPVVAATNPRKKPQFYSDDLNTPISINI